MNTANQEVDPTDFPVTTIEEFWTWFQMYEPSFYHVVTNRNEVQGRFHNHLINKLMNIKSGVTTILTPGKDGSTSSSLVELVFTANADLAAIPFVEDLVAAAPTLENWQFKALKQPANNKHLRIRIEKYEFHLEKIKFYSTVDSAYPDDINLTFVYDEWNAEHADLIHHGVKIFLDFYLGELALVTKIDSFEVIGQGAAQAELVDLSKLNAYLNWREMEFIEKYEGLHKITEADDYGNFDAEDGLGNTFQSTLNINLLRWDSKASHPWIFKLVINFEGDEKRLPTPETYEMIYALEKELGIQLKDEDGYLHIGRTAAGNVCEIYFACRDFRKPAKVLDKLHKDNICPIFSGYNIVKDKYWKTFKHYEDALADFGR